MFEQNRNALSKLASAAADIYGGASDRLYGMKEVGASMLSGAVAQPVSGLGGLMALASGRNPTKTINSLQGLLTYQPQTEFGREYANGLARLMAPVAEISEDARGRLGDGAYRLTGSPAAAALAYSTPEALAAYLGVRKVMTPKTAAARLNTGAYKGQRGAAGVDDGYAVISSQRYLNDDIVSSKMKELVDTGANEVIVPLYDAGNLPAEYGPKKLAVVADKHHRAEAARRLGLPVKFEIIDHPEKLKGVDLLDQAHMGNDWYDYETGNDYW